MKNRLVYGDFKFNDKTLLKSPSIQLNQAPVSESMEADTFTFPVESWDHGPEHIYTVDGEALFTVDEEVIIVADPDIEQFVYGTEAYYFRDDELHSKFYVENIERRGRNQYVISGISLPGLLAQMPFYGDVYEKKPIIELIDELLEGFSYSIAADIATERINGLIKPGTKRSALKDVLISIGASLVQDANGDAYICYAGRGNAKDVSDTDVYIGGSVKKIAPVTRVDVTEHAYIAFDDDAEIVLYDNITDGSIADHLIITFNEPCHDLKWNGETLPEDWKHSANYAIVSGVGVLTGKRYSHTTNIVSVNTEAGSVEKVVTLSDVGIINYLNSPNVAKRLASYYGGHNETTTAFALRSTKIKPLDMVRFKNVFGEFQSGFVSSMNIVVSGLNKANCVIGTDYDRGPFGSNYTVSDLITADGTWIVPDGVTKIRVVLAAGGAGGGAGQNGQLAPVQRLAHYELEDPPREYRPYMDTPVDASMGGKQGAPGLPGKVLVREIDVIPGTILTFTIGKGGLPGIASNEAYGISTSPEQGTDTLLIIEGETFSSADGVILENGYTDMISGDHFSMLGESGYDGADGGIRFSSVYSSESVPNNPRAADGQSLLEWRGGLGAQNASSAQEPIGPYYTWGTGSSGGGAAYGNDGGDGTESYLGSVAEGGDGANAEQNTDLVALGSGGHAGNGGGGAGQGGFTDFIWWSSWNGNYYYAWKSAESGAFGKASDGTAGGDGYAIVYH